MVRNALLAIALVGSLCTLGCSTADKSDAKTGEKVTVINKTCPVEGGEVPADTKLVTSYKGKTVGFCCDGCQGKWAKMTDKERDAALAKATK